jgi:hypothetical protein
MMMMMMVIMTIIELNSIDSQQIREHPEGAAYAQSTPIVAVSLELSLC